MELPRKRLRKTMRGVLKAQAFSLDDDWYSFYLPSFVLILLCNVYPAAAGCSQLKYCASHFAPELLFTFWSWSSLMFSHFGYGVHSWVLVVKLSEAVVHECLYHGPNVMALNWSRVGRKHMPSSSVRVCVVLCHLSLFSLRGEKVQWEYFEKYVKSVISGQWIICFPFCCRSPQFASPSELVKVNSCTRHSSWHVKGQTISVMGWAMHVWMKAESIKPKQSWTFHLITTLSFFLGLGADAGVHEMMTLFTNGDLWHPLPAEFGIFHSPPYRMESKIYNPHLLYAPLVITNDRLLSNQVQQLTVGCCFT